MKWYVIVDKYIDGRECVGINDESYYGDGVIISTHATDDEADSAAREYAQASGLPLLADIEEEADSMKMKEIIKNAEEIKIVSGEGEQGTVEDYEGTRTERAICMRLAKEESGGDRWAFARIDGVRYDRKDNELIPRY